MRGRLTAIVTAAVLFLSCAMPAVSGEADAHAVGKSKSYKVTFNVNGGKVLTKAKSTKTVTMGKKYGSLPTPARTGYSFKGWYTAKSGGSKITATSKVSTKKKITKLYAHWAAKKYIVTFNVNGGKVLTKAKSTKTVTMGKKYGSLPTPARTGYSFKGWYTAKSGGSKITATSKVSVAKAITLYAQWTKNSEVTVTFDSNGGPALPDAKRTASVHSERYQGKTLYYYGDLPDSDDFGGFTYRWPYQFMGWYTAKSGGKKVASNSAAASDKSHTLYAQWKDTILTPIITGPLKELTDSMPQPDYEIVLQTSIYIFSNYRYGEGEVNDGIFNKEDVKSGSLVCSEAADLTYNLLKAYGFEYEVEQVQAAIVTPPPGHAWNIVKVQDKWYHLDNTPPLDPTGPEFRPFLYHLFLFSDALAEKTPSHYRTYSKFPCPTTFTEDHPEIVKAWRDRYGISDNNVPSNKAAPPS
jgi:uncharacterized repeat protein (TIGR02543 family)